MASNEPRPLRRLLIANRGEIAVRIIRACRESAIESVAVYSDADADALHVRLADRAERIGAAAPSESYLNISAILEAAVRSGADSVHPGYGFLSERGAFAQAIEDAGLVFVGPTADAIERMGSKIGARALMEAAGVPIVPGSTPADQSDDGIAAAARGMGFPVLVKASAGGGGRGMRVIRRPSDTAELIAAARREAAAAFGDGTLYVEKLIERPRHVEVQIFGDSQGNIIHLFERECSLQRRHQKVVEESPSPVLTAALRERMGRAAVAAARAVAYRNAGTVEFLVEGEGDAARFYFLEMNTRLQVEHPVTEAVAGVDLVRAQLAVAAGAPLPWTQDALQQRGHAIECRIYAEDPAADFMPQAGPLLVYREPSGPGIRIDGGVVQGDNVGVSYDAMLAKLIATAETREAAITRCLTALRTFPILGIRTNIPFLIRVLTDPDVVRGAIHTGFLDEHHARLTASSPAPKEAVAAAALATEASARATAGQALATDAVDPWSQLTNWGR